MHLAPRSGTVNQTLSVHHMDGSLVNKIQYNDGFLGQRASPVSVMAFHPLRPLLAAASNNRTMAVYGLAFR